MDVCLATQLEIIDMEGLVSCKANFPVMTPYEKNKSIIVDSQDLHILCKLAKPNNVDVILYSERKLEREHYYIDKEMLQEQYNDIFTIIESDIDKYNEKSQLLDYDNAKGAIFYFFIYGKYFIQEVEYTNNQEMEILPYEQYLKGIMELRKDEIDKIRENQKYERESLLNEFLDYVRKDSQFIALGYKDYSRYVFASNNETEKYRTLFYSQDDVHCENSAGYMKCYRELEELFITMKKERNDYKKTEEYAKLMLEFEEFVRGDGDFWKYSFQGHRRDYSYQVFLTNIRAKKYRTLFYFESDVECKETDARRDCFYKLERIYNEGK